jgi:hypothetical protein
MDTWLIRSERTLDEEIGISTTPVHVPVVCRCPGIDTHGAPGCGKHDLSSTRLQNRFGVQPDLLPVRLPDFGNDFFCDPATH